MDIVVDIFVFVVSKSASLKLTNEPTISVLYVLSFERGLRFLIPLFQLPIWSNFPLTQIIERVLYTCTSSLCECLCMSTYPCVG